MRSASMPQVCSAAPAGKRSDENGTASSTT
jgi:hypothetical protein